ncbi:unnamed protein product [Closterium sp. NIES-53]
MSFAQVIALRHRWLELLRSGVDIFALDYDAILAAMYALSVSAEGDCYLCVPPDPGIEAAALGASESALPSTAPAEALHTFTLDSVLARSSIVLPCPAVPFGSLSSLHLPSFSTNLVSASGPVAAPCSCRLLSHKTLLWHHRLGHPPLPRLRGMHSGLLCAASHSYPFPPKNPPLQTLHMDVWGPTRINGQDRERYFLLVVDDYTQYTMVFPLRSKDEHSDRGGEFSSDLLREFCRGEGILQSLMLPASLQQNGVVERRIGLVMEVARASMIHVSAPFFRGRLQSGTLRISLTFGPVSPCRRPRLHCVGRGRLVMRRCSGSGALMPLFAILSQTSSPPVLFPASSLGFPPDALGWQFYHPTSRRVLPSQNVTFDESVPFYRLFLPYRTAPPPPPPFSLAPGPPLVDPLPPQGPAPLGAARGAASGAAASGGAELASAEAGGAEPEGAEAGGADSEGAESGDAEPEGA